MKKFVSFLTAAAMLSFSGCFAEQPESSDSEIVTDYISEKTEIIEMTEMTEITENKSGFEDEFFEMYFSDEEKQAYSAICEGIARKSEFIELPCPISDESYEKIYLYIEKQRPDFFYIAKEYYISERLENIRMIYRDNIDFLYNQIDVLDAEKDKILRNTRNSGDFEKVLYFHDYISQNCTYNRDGSDNDTAYGCLVEKQANCSGYAKAFKYLCDSAEIPCILVLGMGKDESHAWNQVKINGKWYNIDVTWDDCDDEFETVHTYFLCSDSDFPMHIPDIGVKPLFKCTEDSDNYYIKNDAFIANQDDAERILAEKFRNFSENIELKFSDEYTYNEFKNVYITNQRAFDIFYDNNSGFSSKTIRCLMKEFEGSCVIVLRFS